MPEIYVAQALIAPRKYVQRRGLLSSLGNYIQQLALEDRPTAEINHFIHNMPFSVDAEIVCDAMIAADAYGRAFRRLRGHRST